MTEIAPSYEDEVELIDILRILWKWKFFILVGTFVCAVASVFYSLSLPRVYKAEMTVQPGFLKVDDNGERVYVNSLKSISGRVSAGIYDLAIISSVVNKSPGGPELKDLHFGLSIPAESNVLKVSYETIDLKEGSAVLNHLFQSIAKEESELLKGVVSGYNHKITINKSEILKSENLIRSYNENVKTIDKRISEIRKDIEKMNKNSIFLSYERKKLLEQKTDDKESLSVLLYSNTIQQSIQFVNRVKKDLNEHQALKEEEVQKIIVEKDNKKKTIQENYNLETERDGIKKMQILIKPEDGNLDPVKPRRTVIVLLGLIAGIFLFVFCSFIAEYLKNNKLTKVE